MLHLHIPRSRMATLMVCSAVAFAFLQEALQHFQSPRSVLYEILFPHEGGERTHNSEL